jgi:hypothetical protein
MSDFFNRNSSQVQITKLDSTTSPNAPTQAPINVERYDIAQSGSPGNSPNTPSLTPIPVVDVTDSDEGSEYSYGDGESDGDSDGDSDGYSEDSDGSQDGDLRAESRLREQLSGGKHDIDNESTSSVSTTEILSRDPLFLVLSEFLMDEATGNNIVHVGNGLVQVLNKINSKLGRIADALEKKNKSHKTEDRKK